MITQASYWFNSKLEAGAKSPTPARRGGPGNEVIRKLTGGPFNAVKRLVHDRRVVAMNEYSYGREAWRPRCVSIGSKRGVSICEHSRTEKQTFSAVPLISIYSNNLNLKRNETARLVDGVVLAASIYADTLMSK